MSAEQNIEVKSTPEIDQATIDFVAMLIKEKHESLCPIIAQKVARSAIEEDKIQDDNWMTESIEKLTKNKKEKSKRTFVKFDPSLVKKTIDDLEREFPSTPRQVLYQVAIKGLKERKVECKDWIERCLEEKTQKYVEVRDFIDSKTQELLARAEFSSLPKAMLEDVLREAEKCRKLHDDNWIEKNLKARIRGSEEHDRIFTQFLKEEIALFKECFGQRSFDFMKKYLNNPRLIHPRWASRFIETVNNLDIKEVEKHKNDMYKFVTSTEEWKKHKNAYAKFRKLKTTKASS